MPRLPQPGSDQGTWGQILNDYLSAAHNNDGTLKSDTVGATQLQANSVTASQLAPGAVSGTEVQNGTITEAKLSTAVQTKLNTGGGAVSSVAGKTGAVTLVKGDVGLGNVDNTSDANKPVSTATQTALNAKASTASLASVATSGDYGDLSNRPTIPTVSGSNTGDQTLSISGNNLSISGGGGNTISIPTGGGGGSTNLSTSTTATAVTILSDTGSSATLPAATTTDAGVLTAADRTKLNSVASGATANASDAQLRDRSTHTGTQAISTVSGLQGVLDGKAGNAHTHTTADTTTGTFTLDRMPAGYRHTVYESGGSYTRGTARTDICVVFVGESDPGSTALNGDTWDQVVV